MDFGSILEEIAADLKRPSVFDVTVSEEAIRSRSMEMAKAGYIHTRQSLEALEAYLKGYGIGLIGPVGTGKTMFFRVVRPLNVTVRETGKKPCIVVFGMARTLGMGVDELNDFLEEHKYDEVVLDDVGTEPLYNFYGEKMEILPYILDRRMESPCRTHMTSNLTIRDIGERYGVRVVDRINEMVSVHRLQGPSNRQLRPNLRINEAQERYARTSTDRHTTQKTQENRK